MQFRKTLRRYLVPEEIETQLSRLPKRLGSLGYDPWGYNTDTTAIAMTLVGQIYKHYFRVRAHGLENVPKSGRLLIIGNHAGQLPMDGVMVGYALTTNAHGPRLPRAMIERFFPTVPWLGNLVNQLGGVIGDPLNCEKMLERGEAVIVFPEGIRGSGKPYSKRYQLQRFGQGFMHLALQHDTPILPVGIVGSEETMPSLGSIDPLARMLSIPYFPISPLLPLPARMTLHFGKPMHFAPTEDRDEITAYVEEVKSALSELIDTGLAQREKVF